MNILYIEIIFSDLGIGISLESEHNAKEKRRDSQGGIKHLPTDQDGRTDGRFVTGSPVVL